jgi:Protein of unknown function (DUF3027)
MARSTKRVCCDCGFFLPLSGSLGAMFGVCGNELSADGHIVDKRYGCGAHSDTPAPVGSGSPAYEPYDDGVLDVMETPSEAPTARTPPEPPESDTEPPEPAAESQEPAGESSESEAESPEPAAQSQQPVVESSESEAESPE